MRVKNSCTACLFNMCSTIFHVKHNIRHLNKDSLFVDFDNVTYLLINVISICVQ